MKEMGTAAIPVNAPRPWPRESSLHRGFGGYSAEGFRVGKQYETLLQGRNSYQCNYVLVKHSEQYHIPQVDLGMILVISLGSYRGSPKLVLSTCGRVYHLDQNRYRDLCYRFGKISIYISLKGKSKILGAVTYHIEGPERDHNFDKPLTRSVQVPTSRRL